VILAYTSSPVAIKRATGWNFVPRAVGEEIHARLVELLDAGRIRPIIGATLPFTELPAALAALEQRNTMGRTVVELGSRGLVPDSPGG
jgi:NADPH2:quinone reductase